MGWTDRAPAPDGTQSAPGACQEKERRHASHVQRSRSDYYRNGYGQEHTSHDWPRFAGRHRVAREGLNCSSSFLPSGPTRCSSLSMISSGVNTRSNSLACPTSQRMTFDNATAPPKYACGCSERVTSACSRSAYTSGCCTSGRLLLAFSLLRMVSATRLASVGESFANVTMAISSGLSLEVQRSPRPTSTSRFRR
jgi:hypothetical protein